MTQASDIVAELDRLYTASVARLQQALTEYFASRHDARPAQSRSDGSFAYPEIRWTYRATAIVRRRCARSAG
jgi:AMP nucleosidase